MNHDKLRRRRAYANKMYKARFERPDVRNRLLAIRFTEEQYLALKAKFKQPSTALWKMALQTIKKEIVK